MDKRAKLIKDEKGKVVIRITFDFDFTELDRVRTLPGRRFYKEKRYWTAPLTPESVKSLYEWGYQLSKNLTEYKKRVDEQTLKIVTREVEGIRGTLFPFQKEGVAFIESRKGRALIADEMGLGKTVQALAWLQMHPELRPVVIVVPASLKLNWEREANKWMTDPQTEILSGKRVWRPEGSIVIINYDILPEWVDVLSSLFPKVMITDECHYYKSNKTKRTRAVKKLAKGIPNVIALSGTPIVNRPIEAYNAIRIIDPELFNDPWLYAKRYCRAHRNRFGLDMSGASHTKELHDILIRTIMIRRKKADVLTELPEKTISYVPLELSNITTYREAERNFIAFLRKEKGHDAARRASGNAEALVKFEALRQLSMQGKMDQAVDWIRNFLDIDGKLVVFATHRLAIDHLALMFAKVCVRIDGSTSMSDRQKIVDAFQNDPKVRLFIGNIRAAGVGLTLTAASNVAFIELPWTPGELVQAEDRCHRIGQKDAVNVHYLLAAGTVEERIANIIDSKRKVLDSVLDGQDTPESSLLTELIKSYTEDDKPNKKE